MTMTERLRTLVLRYPASLLALVTALLFLLLFALPEPGVLPLALAVLYAAGGGIVWRRRTQSSSEQITSEFALVTTSANELSELATRMTVTVDGLVRAADAISSVSDEQAGGAAEQAEIIESTKSLLDNFLQLTDQITEQARSVTGTAQEAAEISDSGQQALREVIAGMDDIRTQVEAIAGTIQELARLTGKVDAIITSVSEIATQSNLLALNASIEAARAGTQGRGFAVVADEVRALSQQSTDAATQVRQILADIQSAMEETIKATQKGMEGVDTGMSRTREANETMVQLAENVTTSHETVQAIYDVIQQQADDLEQIAIGMERIDRITQQYVASTQTVETVSTNLSRLASDLQKTVEQSQMLPVDGDHSP